MKYILMLSIAILIIQESNFLYASECSKKDAEMAQIEYGSIPKENWTWVKLHMAFSRFGQCVKSEKNGWYSAELAYGFNDAVQHLLLDKWSSISELEKISKRDSKFLEFVTSQINEDLSIKDIETIRYNSKNNCPISAKNACESIIESIEK